MNSSGDFNLSSFIIRLVGPGAGLSVLLLFRDSVLGSLSGLDSVAGLFSSFPWELAVRAHSKSGGKLGKGLNPPGSAGNPSPAKSEFPSRVRPALFAGHSFLRLFRSFRSRLRFSGAFRRSFGGLGRRNYFLALGCRQSIPCLSNEEMFYQGEFHPATHAISYENIRIHRIREYNNTPALRIFEFVYSRCSGKIGAIKALPLPSQIGQIEPICEIRLHHDNLPFNLGRHSDWP